MMALEAVEYGSHLVFRAFADRMAGQAFLEGLRDYLDFIAGARLICLKSKFFVSVIQWTCRYALAAKSSSERPQ
jgi:hypothetical protein